MTQAQLRKAIQLAGDAICEAVAEAGDSGAPAGVMYAALMDKMSLNQFNSLMGALVQAGRLRKEGYFYVVADPLTA